MGLVIDFKGETYAHLIPGQTCGSRRTEAKGRDLENRLWIWNTLIDWKGRE